MCDEYGRVKSLVLREALKTKASFAVKIPAEEMRWWQKQYDASRGMGVDVRPDWTAKTQTVSGSLLMCLKYLARAMEKDAGYSVGSSMKLESALSDEAFVELKIWIEQSYPRFFDGKDR